MEGKIKLSDNDLKTVTGGAGLTEQQWDAVTETVNKLSLGNMLSDADKKELIECIAKRDLNTLIPKVSGCIGQGPEWDMLRNVLGSFVNLTAGL